MPQQRRKTAAAQNTSAPHYRTRPGNRYPIGATPVEGGINFSLFSRHATAMELLLYERADSPEPFQTVTLDPQENRSFFFWHVLVEDLPVGTHYTWRVDGPNDARLTGRRFDRHCELLDPAAKAVTDLLWDRARALDPPHRNRTAFRGAVVDDRFDWTGDRKVAHDLRDAVIYELHVGGFTRHPSSGVRNPGTFAGLIGKIPYLKELGITHVELLPVMAFDRQDRPPGVADRGLYDYWGYSPCGYFSPHPGYCVMPQAARHPHEFKELVKALHQAGIGVILDVVFNHTAEGDEDGPTIHFKGLANEIYYHLDPKDRRRYLDFTGCGNTLNCNHPFVTQYILQCLEYWAQEMRVDGFRFDLASVFSRGDCGVPMANPPLPWAIEFSRILAERPLIAEAWDASGLYQVGHFPGLRWAEWNGRYRDVIRRFVRGDGGLIAEVATAIAGSSDLYAEAGRPPQCSINYITCHDGFTLWDLVSYNLKHNEANGEDNRDGYDDNLSWNCGTEGATDDPEIQALRRRQARNFIAILMLSLGVPMLSMGDEVLRTQHGNNNAWCQDNQTSWFDWTLVQHNAAMLRFTRELIALRTRHPSLRRGRHLSGLPLPGRDIPDIRWHGPQGDPPQWHDRRGSFLAYILAGLDDIEPDLYVALNMSEYPLQITLPRIAGRLWHRAVDTHQTAPEDAIVPERQRPHEAPHYLAQARSVVVFEGRSIL